MKIHGIIMTFPSKVDKVGTHPPGATCSHFLVRIEWRARYVAVQVAGLLLEESRLVRMRVRPPTLEDVID
jgi:hypothetical protein